MEPANPVSAEILPPVRTKDPGCRRNGEPWSLRALCRGRPRVSGAISWRPAHNGKQRRRNTRTRIEFGLHAGHVGKRRLRVDLLNLRNGPFSFLRVDTWVCVRHCGHVRVVSLVRRVLLGRLTLISVSAVTVVVAVIARGSSSKVIGTFCPEGSTTSPGPQHRARYYRSNDKSEKSDAQES